MADLKISQLTGATTPLAGSEPLPLVQSSTTKKATVDNILTARISTPLATGYKTGAGGAVTQTGSKSGTVTLNKPVGQITMTNDALAAGATVTFQVTNSLCASSDCVIASTVDDFGVLYSATAVSIWDGYFNIAVTNISALSRSQAVRINFAIIKGATA